MIEFGKKPSNHQVYDYMENLKVKVQKNDSRLGY